MDTNPGPASETGGHKLSQVHEGMAVYDREGHRIGKADQVFLGNVSEEADRYGLGPQTTGGQTEIGLPATGVGRIDALEDDLDEHMPDVLRNRLLRSGFIRMGGGLLGRDRYALPEQVDSVSEKGVHLSVLAEDLLTDAT